MLDNNVNSKNQIPYQAIQPGAQEQPVPMQAGIPANPELLQENIQDTYVANRVADTTDDPKAMMGTAALMVPTWFALTQAMDKFAKHSRGDYEGTIQHKIAEFGDKVADSSFAKSSFMTSLGEKVKSFNNFVKTKIIDRSRITRALFNTPSLPENGMAVANYKGMIAMQLFDYPQHGEAFVKPLKHPSNLDIYGATADEIRTVESQWKNATTVEAKAKILQEAEFKTIMKYTREPAEAARLAQGFAAADATKKASILKDLKAFNWGFNDFAHMERLSKKTHENIPEIFEATHKANRKMMARIWGSNSGFWGKLSTKIFGREVYATETLNKMFAELGNIDLTKPENAKWKDVLTRTGYIDKLPKSAFARSLNKYTHLITEGLTNRVAGGKAVALIQSWFIAEALYKAFKAEGGIGEKGKTFAERITELVAMLACIPLALKLMHSVGGLQYAGMTKEQVAQYREHLKAFNEKAMRGGFASKAEWKAGKKELLKELNAGVKNPFVKLAKRIGRIVTVGLEQIRPYDKKDIGDIAKDGTKTYRKGIMSKIRDLFRHGKFGLKQMAGYPMRIGIGMMLIMPFLTKIAVKGSHLIFGKPKHSLLDEEKERELAEKQAEQLKTQVPPQLLNQSVQPAEKENANILNNKQNEVSNIKVNNVVSKPNEPVRTYVPSPVGVQITGQEDLTAAEAAMRRADSSEQQALQTLKMK